MSYLRYVLAGAGAAIVGLLAYGLAPSHHAIWCVAAAAVAFAGILATSSLVLRADDRDPTIRPTNVSRSDRRPDRKG